MIVDSGFSVGVIILIIAEMVTLSEVLGGMGEFMAASETEIVRSQLGHTRIHKHIRVWRILLGWI